MQLTWIAVAGAFLLASYIKGTTGMGFPLIATPMVAMLVDIRTTYALLLLPNILMDVVQIARGELPWHLWRRLAPLLSATVVGVVLGTMILVRISERTVFFALAGVIVLFLAGTRVTVDLRVPAGWEIWLGPTIGFVSGLLTGVTNIVGPLGAFYLLALQFEKRDFVKGIASTFLAAKLSQLAAIARWGLYTAEILRWSAGLTVVALAAFWVGLRTQDRVRQETFIRILHVLLLGMALFFVHRGLFGVSR
jgi:uncharacterized membrane protein YfcA